MRPVSTVQNVSKIDAGRIGVNVPGLPMAGFQVTLHGRIWVTPEGCARRLIFESKIDAIATKTFDWSECTHCVVAVDIVDRQGSTTGL